MEKSCCMGAAALFVYIFCTDQLGDTNCAGGFALMGGSFFSTG